MLDPKRIGHTGITWPTEPVEQKVADVAAVGFTAFETFGHVIEQYPGGAPAFRDLIQGHGLKYAASYCARTSSATSLRVKSFACCNSNSNFLIFILRSSRSASHFALAASNSRSH